MGHRDRGQRGLRAHLLEWPFAFCWCCHGKGKHFRRGGKLFRDCEICASRGRRFRVEALLFARARSGRDE
ncbi:hypothetical protein H7X46_07910 [Pseudonocardia sp. C8]|uniref:hypothetical protein n=1 Tax=Pseudonocardia sp. C8 TaxID=2762759 RepID=UPI001642D246|nr:hypothetical protein [Pseudonocardia sp. C8]MBC3190985.1 hypothetical protein [Pseudonocardia sp. C8]